jgi:hypothetical protein
MYVELYPFSPPFFEEEPVLPGTGSSPLYQQTSQPGQVFHVLVQVVTFGRFQQHR